MARTTPRVEGSTLVGGGGDAGPIAIGTQAWYTWLEQATTFAVAITGGSFTARKERSGQSGGYWKAYRKHEGRLQSAYLGKSADLTLERLQAVAISLGATAETSKRFALPIGTLTFLFTDIEGSTQLWEQHHQAMHSALARHDAIVLTAIEAHGGLVFKTVGDSVHAVFVRATDALFATLAAQRGLHDEPWGLTGPLRMRVALHSGVAEERNGDYFGAPLNRIARILALGHGGQILLARATHDLVADDLPPQMTLQNLGEYHLKDLNRPEQVFQLMSPELPAVFPPLRTLEPQPSRSPPAASPLLATKLYIPALRPQIVPRPRLIERLQVGLMGKLTLISAPAGFGKTTLLSAWHSGAHGATLLAWVSLDAADRDPVRFWSYVLTALDTLQPGIAADTLQALQFAPAPPIEGLLTQVLNALTALPTDAALVLDDFHAVDSPPIHETVAFVLDHLPPRLHLVITTRADPPLPLARLRARGDLTELRAADLRFTPDEVAVFLTEVMRLPLAAGEVTALEARTEGWIAGLQLAALAMRDRADYASFVAAFTGSNRYVLDYLAEEVLNRLPAQLQTFVLQSSILERLCSSVCDMVVRDENAAGKVTSSQVTLEELERSNLFLVPLDDERIWYRYHHLFAEVLRARLHASTTQDNLAALHHRASLWYEQNGLRAQAIQHALEAADWTRSAQLIEANGPYLTHRSESERALAWLNMLPDELVRTRPALCVSHATALMFTDHLEDAEARLQQAEQQITDKMPPEQTGVLLGQIAQIRAIIARFVGDMDHALALARQVLIVLPEHHPGRTFALVTLARGYLVSGDVTATSERLAHEAVAAASASGNGVAIVTSLVMLGRLQALQGRLQQCGATYASALRAVQGPVSLQTLMGGPLFLIAMGDLLRERNDLEAAEDYLTQGIELLRTHFFDADIVLLGFTALARLRQARGDRAGGLAALEEFMQIAHVRNFVDGIIARGTAARAQLWLEHGNRADAVQWAKTAGVQPEDDVVFPREREYLTLARILIAQGREEPSARYLNDAQQLLERLLQSAEAGARMGSTIEMLVLLALTLQERHNIPAAHAALQRALTLAAPENYVRSFVDEEAPMAALLQIAAHESPVAAYATTLLEAFPKADRPELTTEAADSRRSAFRSQPVTLAEPLSVREHEILHLIAEGHSNQAIANRLVVAVSTVKKHVNNIYGKLDVQSRTQALLRARELNLL